MSQTLPAFAQRPWGKRGDAYCWTAALKDRYGHVRTWYCNSRAAAEYKINHHCCGSFGNTGTLANADDATFLPVSYAYNVDVMRAMPIPA